MDAVSNRILLSVPDAVLSGSVGRWPTPFIRSGIGTCAGRSATEAIAERRTSNAELENVLIGRSGSAFGVRSYYYASSAATKHTANPIASPITLLRCCFGVLSDQLTVNLLVTLRRCVPGKVPGHGPFHKAFPQRQIPENFPRPFYCIPKGFAGVFIK
jgi:hypothetical protein